MDNSKIDKYLPNKSKYKKIKTIDKILLKDSEDGAGTMTYTAMHPHGGRGRIGMNKGIVCPRCGATINLNKE